MCYLNCSSLQYNLYYRSSYFDAKKAVQLKSDYEKASFRMAQCSFFSKKYDECIELCNNYEKQYGKTEKSSELRNKARETHVKELRDERKRQTEQRKKGELLQRTIDTLKERKIQFEEQLPSTPYEVLMRPAYIPLEDSPIQMDESGELRWPAIFCYPEFEIVDFQQQLSDSTQ